MAVKNLRDLLFHLPREYEDLRHVTDICRIAREDKVLVLAKVLMIIKGKGYGRKRTLRLLTEDKTGRMEVLFLWADIWNELLYKGMSIIFMAR